MHLLDLPDELLSIIASSPLLESADHANMARACTALRRVVRYATICYAPRRALRDEDVNLLINYSIGRLAAALRCATKRNPAGGIVLKARTASRQFYSFSISDVDTVLAVAPELFAGVQRIVLFDGYRDKGSAGLLRVHARLPACNIVVEKFTLSDANVLVVAAASGRRLSFCDLTLEGSALWVGHVLAAVRAPLHVGSLTIYMGGWGLSFHNDANERGAARDAIVEAVKTCGLTADTLIVDAREGATSVPLFVCRMGEAVGRIARKTLSIKSSSDYGTIESVLAAPRAVTRIEIESSADMVECLGVALLNDCDDFSNSSATRAYAQSHALECACLPSGTEEGEFISLALKLNLVRTCVWT